MKQYSVILVDDEPVILHAIRSQLRRHFGTEFDIETATSARQAMELIVDMKQSNMEVPLAICDYMMPGDKGDELIIKLHRCYPETLSILLTGQVNVEAMGKIMNAARLFRYISKPWDELDFVLTVREAVNAYKLNRIIQNQNLQISNYAFANSHTVRGPLARILGLIELLELDPAMLTEKSFVEKLKASAVELDDVVRSITNSLE